VKTTIEDILNLRRCAQAANGASNLLLRNGGYFWKSMRLQSETLMKWFGFFSKTGSMAVVRTGTLVLNGALAIYDVYSLIQTIKNNHPTADNITELISQLQDELQQMRKLKTFLDQIK